jgi:biotin carboxylase
MMKIGILGASYLQKPLVEKANEMGLETHCFALDNEAAVCKDIAHFFYPISVLEKELILEECIRIQINGITTISTDICIPLINYIAEKLNLVANSYESGIACTNKNRMREIFFKEKLNSPKFITLDQFEMSFLKGFKFPLIVKPTDRSGSRGVNKVSNEKELESAYYVAIGESIEKKVIIEEFVGGVEVSVETISWKGKHYILSITDKVTTNAPFFVELEHHQPSNLTIEIQNRIKENTLKALDALDIQFGASHTELKILDDGSIFFIEVGARMGGDFIGSHLVKLSTGYDFVKGVIDVALNEFEMPNILKNNYAGVYFLSKETERILPYFDKKNDFEVEKKKLSDSLVEIKNSNDRSGYLIYKAKKRIKL